MKIFPSILCGGLVLAGMVYAPSTFAAQLETRVNEAFRVVYGRQPSAAENTYWVTRVVKGEKKTFDELQGAMGYQKTQGVTQTETGKVLGATAKVTDKKTLIIETLPLFVKVYGGNPTEAEKAWWRKRIACGELKSLADLENSMSFHKSKKVRKGKDTICGQSASVASTGGIARRTVAGIADHPQGNNVRIGIYHTNGSAIGVTANGNWQVREGADKILKTLKADQSVNISWSGGQYHVRGSGLSVDTDNKIRLVPVGGTIMQVKSYSDPSVTYPGKNYNRFRGVIEIRKCDGCGELWTINELRTELYLRGLGETSGNGPEEYIKALGVAARTYVLYHKVVTGGRKAAQDFDIGNTALDQIYRGYEYEIITPRMTSIFDKTKGIVATNGDGDVPISTVYFSDSDGRTRSAKEVWNSSRFPYLQSVTDPHHAASKCNGHCVGMSAQGAYGFANKDNWSYSKILTYYYKGIKLVKAY